jgi:hypothetical protein
MSLHSSYSLGDSVRGIAESLEIPTHERYEFGGLGWWKKWGPGAGIFEGT